MLKISKLADYATAIMNFLTLTTVVVSAAEISQALSINVPTVSKVLKLLCEAELLHSSRGINGGYQLNRPAPQIFLIEILSAIDGEPALTECSQEHNLCQQDKTCKVKRNWQAINQALMHILQNITLADLHIGLTGHPLIKGILEYQHERK